MNNNTRDYYSPKQGRLPLFLADFLDICDPVLTFDRIMEEIEIEKYLKPEPLCRAIGGQIIKSNADFTARFDFLPRYPLLLKLWLADEEFPASGKLLLAIA